MFAEVARLETRPADPAKSDGKSRSVYFDEVGRVDTSIFPLDKLAVGDVVKGPAVIIDDTQTIIIDPKAEATITSQHLYITLG